MSDLGVLLPHESHYASKEVAREASRAEATQKASYLSQMDQFYAQLEESQRQFNQNYAFREQEFAFESQLKEKQFAHLQSTDTRKLDLQEQMAEIEARLGEQKLKLLEAQTETEREALEIERSRMELDRDRLAGDLEIGRGRLELDRELGGGELDLKRGELELSRQGLGLQEAQTAFEQQLASTKFSLEVENMPKTPTTSGWYSSAHRNRMSTGSSASRLLPTVRSSYSYNRRY